MPPSSDRPLVRPSTPDDIPAITEIYGYHVTHGLGSFEETPPDAAAMAERRLAVLDRGLPHLVAERDGAVVGFASLAPYRPRSAYRFSLEDTVYVAPAAAGSGIGGAMLAALIEIAETGPWRQMIAVIGDRGNTGSIALHASLGFREAGRLQSVGYKHGQWVDVVIMQRSLSGGDTELPA